MRRGSKASSQANLFQGAIAELLVLVPPLARQECFALLAQKWSESVERRAVVAHATAHLRDSLGQRAFRGEL
jgi:hypothetical protein